MEVPTLVVSALAVNFVTIVGGVGKGLAVLIGIRDELRDLATAVGKPAPPDGPSGLLGDMLGVKREISSHRDTLIELTAELGMRRPGGRT